MTRFFCLFFLLPSLFTAHIRLSATVIEVCRNCAIDSPQEALDVAADGDIIRIRKGVYPAQELMVNKRISMIGDEGAVLDGELKGPVMVVQADSVVISGLTFRNIPVSFTKDLAALKFYRSDHFQVTDCRFENVFFGLYIEQCRNGVISGNIVKSNAKEEFNSGNGIHLWHCEYIEISDNEVSGVRDGIYLEFVNHSKVINNISRHNLRYGLHFMFSNYDEYSDNMFEHNGAGVAVMFSKFIDMKRNTFLNNWGPSSYGLLLKEINDASIIDNVFDRNTTGIQAEGTNRIDYRRNIFRENGWAVNMRGGCYLNKFLNNDFLNNTFDISYQGKMNDNEFDGNYWSSYTGYDLDRNGVGDVPYRPVKLFSYVVNETPSAIVLLRSLFVDIINFSEKVSPVFTPDNLLDKAPLMKAAR